MNNNNFLTIRSGQTRRRNWASVQSALSLPLVIFAAILWAIPVFGQEENRAPYTINPGDLLEVSVWKEPDLQREVLVRPDGAFSFPLSGDIVAVGRTVEAIRAELASRLETYIPGLVVTVTVAEIRGNKIFVIGQVKNPGEFIMNPVVDVMQALSIAGGTTPFAQLNNIKILRRRDGVQTILEFRYSDIVKGQDLSQNILLEVGDVVLVP